MVVVWALGLTAAVTVCVVIGLFLIRSSPGWWNPASADDPATRTAAEGVENGVVNQLHAWRKADPASTKDAYRSEAWTVSLQATDANAWLAVALPKWLANQQRPVKLPPELSELQVAFASDVVRIGARLEYDGSHHMLSASVRPEIREDGSLWLRATWVRLGRMPMPASWLLDQAMDPRGELSGSVMKSAEARAVARVLAGLDPAAKVPEIRLADGRRVRLLKVEPRDGQLWLTCRTEGRP